MISLSVIVCTRNRPQQLRDCLVRIGSLAPPAGVTVEVLVVNNGPRDGVADLVAEVAQASPLSFHYLEEPARGLAHGRNRGLRAACGRLIAFTDDDCLPADDWLAALVTVFDERPEVDLLGGRVELHDPSDRRVTVKTKPEREVLESATGLDGFVHGCNLAFRRSLVDRIGGFDPRFGSGSLVPGAEDTDLIYRAFLAGRVASYEPSVVVAHAHGRKTAAAEERLRRGYRIAIGALQTKYLLRGDRGMRAWMAHDLGRHLGAARSAWRSPRQMAAALGRASHHLQGSARFLLAAGLALGHPRVLRAARDVGPCDDPATARGRGPDLWTGTGARR
jgi:GT2 family glycosyltransferase